MLENIYSLFVELEQKFDDAMSESIWERYKLFLLASLLALLVLPILFVVLVFSLIYHTIQLPYRLFAESKESKNV